MADWPPKKNATFTVTFPIYDNDGDLVTAAAALDSEVSKDGGTFTDCTNEAAEIATSSGLYTLSLTATEMNADIVATITKTSTTDAKTAVNVMYTATRQLVDLAFPTTSGRSIDTTATGAVGVDFDNVEGTRDAAEIGTGAITAAKFAAGAIDAAAIANGAIDAATFAAGAIDAAAIATGAIDAATFAAGAIDAAAIATGASAADALAADAANEIADAILSRDVDNVEATAPVHSLCVAILKAVSRIRDNAGTLEVYRTDGLTLKMSQTVTTDATLNPVDELSAGS